MAENAYLLHNSSLGGSKLFSSLAEYLGSLNLEDLSDGQASQIKFLHRFVGLSTPTVPKTPGNLVDCLQANNEFIEAAAVKSTEAWNRRSLRMRPDRPDEEQQ